MLLKHETAAVVEWLKLSDVPLRKEQRCLHVGISLKAGADGGSRNFNASDPQRRCNTHTHTHTPDPRIGGIGLLEYQLHAHTHHAPHVNS